MRPGGELATYATISDGKKAFIKLWTTSDYYKGLPTAQKAKTYSGLDNWQDWYDNVSTCYNK
jgi:hypothetical protein